MSRFPFLAWAVVLVRKSSATSARRFDLLEAAECLLSAFPSSSDQHSPQGTGKLRHSGCGARSPVIQGRGHSSAPKEPRFSHVLQGAPRQPEPALLPLA